MRIDTRERNKQKENDMSIQILLFILAAIAFALDAFKVSAAAVSWTPLGYCLLTIALFLV